MDIGHGQQVGGVAVHDDAVVRVHAQPRGVAHHVGGELAGELAAAGEAPQQLGGLAPLTEADEPQVVGGVVLHVLEILARTRHQEILSLQRRGLKPGGDVPEHRVHVQILRYLRLVQQPADVAAVALIPAVLVHVGAGAHHFHQKGRFQNVFHHNQPLLLSTSASYCSTRGNHAPSSGTPLRRQYSSQISPKGAVFSSSWSTISRVKSPPSWRDFSSSTGWSRADSRAFCRLRKPVAQAAKRLMEASK